MSAPPVRAGTTRRALVACLCASALALSLHSAPATAVAGGDDGVQEYEVKAAALPHFLRYTTWPKDAFGSKDAPFVLLVVGEDPFGATLDKIMAKVRVEKREVRIVRRKDLEELPKAHLVFLARSHADGLEALLDGVAKTDTLVVGDTEGMAEAGAHINLFLDAKRLGFEVNNEAVKRSRLEISSEMLKLAKLVKDKRRRASAPEEQP